MTSRAVCYRIELAVAKTFIPGLASQIPQLDIQTILPEVFPLKHSKMSKRASPYFYTGVFVAVYLSKMATIMVGSTIKAWYVILKAYKKMCAIC